MKREQLIQVARAANDGAPSALAAFKLIAKRAGYAGRVGGWIYRNDAPVARGWQALAAQILEPHTYTTARVILEAHPEPAPKPAPETHAYESGYSGRSCSVMVVAADGSGDACGQPWDAPIHEVRRSEPAEPRHEPPAVPTRWSETGNGKFRTERTSAVLTLAHRMEVAARAHRVVRTSMVPTNHIAPLRVLTSGDAGGIGRLLCGRLTGGPLSPLDLDHVDCLGCLDAYVAALAGKSPDPHRPADPPAEVRSPLIAP